MAIGFKRGMDKQAGKASDVVKALIASTKSTALSADAAAAFLGMVGGLGVGTLSSIVRSRNDDLENARRQGNYYKRKIEEMENERWLNDLMNTKRKLDNARMDDAERKRMESKYINLINR